MGIFSRIVDTGYSLRFLRLLTTPWEKTGAFKAGIIDKDGKNLIKSRDIKDQKDKSVYTLFHRLVFNLKRLLGKIPFGKTSIASYAAALLLLKEETGMSEKEIIDVLFEAHQQQQQQYNNTDREIILEVTKETDLKDFIDGDGDLIDGDYLLTHDIISEHTGEPSYRKNTKITYKKYDGSTKNAFGSCLFGVTHDATKSILYVSQDDIKK